MMDRKKLIDDFIKFFVEREYNSINDIVLVLPEMISGLEERKFKLNGDEKKKVVMKLITIIKSNIKPEENRVFVDKNYTDEQISKSIDTIVFCYNLIRKYKRHLCC